MLSRLLLFVFCIGILVQCKGESSEKTKIEIQDAWIRMVPESASTTAGYATILNHGGETVLLSAQSEISETVELHEMMESEGMMKMRVKQGGFPVGAHKSLRLQPGGNHLMFIGLKRPLRENEKIRVTLVWNNQEATEFDFPVLLRKDTENEIHNH